MTYFPQAEEERRRQEELQRIEEEEMKKNKTKSKFKKAMSTIKKSRQQERSNKSSPTKVRKSLRQASLFTCMQELHGVFTYLMIKHNIRLSYIEIRVLIHLHAHAVDG